MALRKTSTSSTGSRHTKSTSHSRAGMTSSPIWRGSESVKGNEDVVKVAKPRIAKSISYAFESASNESVIGAIRSGANAALLPAFARELNLSAEQLIAALALPRSTIKRNQGLGKALSHESTDRIYRATRVYESAVRIFEDQPAAVRWLQRARAVFNGANALSLVDTTPGYELVLAELGRIEAGVVA